MGRAREPLSTVSIVLFIVSFAANIIALLPAIATPISSLLRQADAAPFIVPAALYALIAVSASYFFRKKPAKVSRWLLWVAVPLVGLVLSVAAMSMPVFAIVLGIYAGIALLGNVVALSFYGGEPY